MQENAVKDGVRVRREARWDQTYPTVPSRIPALTLTAFFDIPRWVLVQNSEAPYAHERPLCRMMARITAMAIVLPCFSETRYCCPTTEREP